MSTEQERKRNLLTHLDYETGLRDGRLDALEGNQKMHNERLDKHEIRLQTQERITYAILGAIALIEFLPLIKVLVK